jgi:hypothetical protein
MCAFARKLYRHAAGSVSFVMFVSPVMALEPTAIPNFSGIWGRNTLNLEQPSSGPGPVVSKLRRPNGTVDAFGAVVGDDTDPILKPQAAEAVRRRGEIELTGKSAPNPHNQCWPEPTPFTLSLQFGMQILQKREEVILLYMGNSQVRHVRLNAPHPPNLIPSWQGNSVGHYEGDTLVVDTVGIKEGPLSIIDMYGAPVSASLHVIERYHLIDGNAARDAQDKHAKLFAPGPPMPFNPYGRGDIDPDPAKKGLQVDITVDDPSMFTRQWSALVTYRRVLGEWPEAICAENTNNYSSNKDAAPPRADMPDF